MMDIMNQPLFNSIRSVAQWGGATLGRKTGSLWSVLLAALCLLGMTMPTQAQVSISFTGTSLGTTAEQNAGSQNYNFRINVGGNGNQTYRITYRTNEGPTATGANSSAFWATSSGTLSQLDFQAKTTTVDIGGNSNATVNVTVFGDTYYEDDEYFNVQLLFVQNVTAAASNDGSRPVITVGNNDQADAIIRNDDGVPNLSVNSIADRGPSSKNYADSFVPELNSTQSNNITFYVTADRINGKGSTGSGGVDSTFTYFTTNGTAIGGTDYAVTNQTVTIPFNTNTLANNFTDEPGNNYEGNSSLVNRNAAPRVPITVATIGDNNDEGDETVNVTLQAVTGGNAIIDPNNATKTGTILDDDAPVASIGDASVTEGDAGTVQMTFPVTLNAPSLQQVQIDYATIDNSAVSETHGSQVQTVSFSATPASGSYTLGVSVNGNPIQTTAAIPFNANAATIQTALINLANVVPTDIISVDLSNNVLTVVFRQTLSRQFSPFVFTPNNLQDSNGAAVTASVNIVNSGLSLPANFQSKTGRLTFPVGSTTQFITINVIGNTIPEGEDLANRFLRFFVQIFVDNNGGNPTFGLTFNDSLATGIINDDDSLSQLSFITNLQTNEGNLDSNGQPQVTTSDFVVQLQGQSGLSVSVNYATSDGTAKSDAAASSGRPGPVDYKSTSGVLKFAPGETTKTISVPVFGDNVDEVNETFFLNISNPNSATILNGQASDLIIDDDGPVVSIDNVSGLEGNSGSTPFNFTLSLSAPSVQPIVVYIQTANGTATGGNLPFTGTTDYESVGNPNPVAYTFQPGETTKTVSIAVAGDLAFEKDETFTVNIKSIDPDSQDPSVFPATIGARQGLGVIKNDPNQNDDTPPAVVIDDASIVEGNGGQTTLNFKVRLVSTTDPTKPASTYQNVSVNYATSDGTAKLSDNDYVQTTGSITFNAALGETVRDIFVPIVGDTKLESDETFTVTLSNPVNTSAGSSANDLSATGTITNDDQAPAQILVTPTAGLVTNEDGTTATFSVSLARQPTADVDVKFASADPSEGLLSSAGQPTPSNIVTLTFTPANYNVVQTVTVTGQDDTLVDGNISYLINSQPSASTDTNYSGLLGPNVSVTNNDNEVPGFNVTPTNVTTSEDGTKATFTVSLRVAPTDDVTVAVSSNNTSEATALPASLTFTPSNFSTPQIVTVTGVDDALRDGSQSYVIGLGVASSADARYNGLDPVDVTGTNIDNDSPGIVVNPTTGLTTTEAGNTATFTVVLTARPSANVTIPLSSDDTTEGTVSPPSLVFTSANYNVPQTVTVKGANDAIIDGDITYHIVTGAATSSDAGYSGLNAANVTVVNTDDELPGIRVNPSTITVNENVGTTTFTVVLITPPSAPVTIPVSSSNTALATVDVSTLTFDNTNYDVPQVVTLTVADNQVDDGNKNLTINLGPATSTDTDYSGLTKIVPVTIVNNDRAGVTITPSTGLRTSETGTTATFTIKLNSQPTGSVTIALSSSNPAEGTVSPASVTFDDTNFSTPKTVTVTGVDDFVDDGDVNYTIVTAPSQSSDAKYNNLNPADVTVTNIDNDTVGIKITPTTVLSVVEQGATATFTVVLNSQPTSTVIIPLSSSDTTQGQSSAGRVVFATTNWNVPQTITVSAVDDFVADGNQPFKIITAPATSSDPKYNGLDAADVSAIAVDNDTAGISVVSNSPTVNGLLTTREDGARVSFSVKLTSQPRSNVTINVSTSDTTEGAPSVGTLTFTPANWNTAQVVFVAGVDDSIEDGNINYTINMSATSSDAGYSGKSVPAFAAVNLDNDDKTAPNVAITSPQDGQVFRVINTVSGTASDANDPTKFYVSGVIKVQVLLFRADDPSTPVNEAGYYNPTTGKYEAVQNLNTQLITASYNASRNAWVANLPQTGTNGLAEGSYRVTAYATDKSGNRKASAPSSFRVDLTPPVVAITTPADGATFASLPKATGTVSDSGSGVNRVEVTVIRQANNANGLPAGYLAKDGSFTSTFSVANNRLPATVTGSSWTINLPTLPPATYSLIAYAFDNGGLGAQQDSHRFTITGANGDEFSGNATFFISVPYMDGSGINDTTTPAKAFSVPPTDPTTGQVNYRLQRYNPITLMYEDLTNTSVLRRGEGYALTPVNRGTHIRRPSEDPTRKGLASTVQEFQITLRNQPSLPADDASNGYNLIGDPFDPAIFSSADWLNARVTANIGGQTFTGTVAQAADRGILDRNLYSFNSTNKTFSPVTGNLLPFRGYFVRTFVDGVQVNLKAVK